MKIKIELQSCRFEIKKSEYSRNIYENTDPQKKTWIDAHAPIQGFSEAVYFDTSEIPRGKYFLVYFENEKKLVRRLIK